MHKSGAEKHMVYGHVRDSVDGQSVGAQSAALEAAGCVRVVREVARGARTSRSQLHLLLNQLTSGDVLVVTRLDRLARSTRDLLTIFDSIASRAAGLRSLGDTWADSTTAQGRHLLAVLGGLAEFERELTLIRTREGRERAKARGVRLGRRPKLTPHQQGEARARRDSGEAVREIARSYNVSNSTVSRLPR